MGSNRSVKEINKEAADLQLAIEHGEEEKVKRLLRYETSVINLEYQGFTPIMRATLKGRTKIINMLLESKTNIDQVNRYNDTADP